MDSTTTEQAQRDATFTPEDENEVLPSKPPRRRRPHPHNLASASQTKDTPELNVRVYPASQTGYVGDDIVLQCREEGPLRTPVRWRRGRGQGGLPVHSHVEDNGAESRLVISKVRPGDAGSYVCESVGYAGVEGGSRRAKVHVKKKRQPWWRSGK